MEAWLGQLRQTALAALAHAGDLAAAPLLHKLIELCERLDDQQLGELLALLGRDLEIQSSLVGGPGKRAALVENSRVLIGPIDVEDLQTARKLVRLRESLESRRMVLLREFANLEGGVKFLVDLRARLLTFMRKNKSVGYLHLINADLLYLFNIWFNPGFLRLTSIDWDTTPAAQLEKLMAYDVVHPMSDWQDLRRRLQKDRLCYAFYHPNMPQEPLVFVEVALTKMIWQSLDRLFRGGGSVESPEEATTAMFYSSSNPQPGLAGVSLGNSLFKRVVAEIAHRQVAVRRFATLSPLPGFRGRYLEPILRGEGKSHGLDAAAVEQMFDKPDRRTIIDAADAGAFPEALAEVLKRSDWHKDQALKDALKIGLLRAATYYLTQEARSGEPIDEEERLHLRSGAMIYNINFLSDTSPAGLAECYGLTVNYLYDPPQIENNQRAYREGRRPIAPQFEKLVQMGTSG